MDSLQQQMPYLIFFTEEMFLQVQGRINSNTLINNILWN
nr:MAG TPA: hypothetical protein [Bacteriophage sp.]